MNILSLEARDFRSLQNIRWEPGNLNVLIGPNGSGKTNLVLFLKLIAQSAQGKLSDSILRLGGISPLLWDRKSKGFGFLLRTTTSEESKKLARGGLIYDVQVDPKGKGGFYSVKEERLYGEEAKSQTNADRSAFVFLERRGPMAKVYADKKSWAEPNPEGLSEEERLLWACGGPFPRNSHVASFQSYLSSWSIYDSLSFHPDAQIRAPVVSRHATQLEPSGSNLINVLHTLYTGNRQFKKDLNAAMKAAFGDEFEELVFPPAADQRVQLRVRWKSLETEISATDLSAGTLQFLFLITVLMIPSPPPLVVIEEPEQYLHPSMLPIVAEHAVDAALRTQVVFTTHSPQFLDAFGDTHPTTTVLECREGRTHLETISGDRLEYWLQAYSLGKLFTSGVLEGES
ncbi:MAG: AAA family ATPase [Isosphaeraceae bacterium]